MPILPKGLTVGLLNLCPSRPSHSQTKTPKSTLHEATSLANPARHGPLYPCPGPDAGHHPTAGTKKTRSRKKSGPATANARKSTPPHTHQHHHHSLLHALREIPPWSHRHYLAAVVLLLLVVMVMLMLVKMLPVTCSARVETLLTKC